MGVRLKSSSMQLTRKKQILLGLLTLFIISFLVVAYTDYQIQKLIQEKRFLVPTQYFSSPQKFYLGQVRGLKHFRDYFSSKRYRLREFGSAIGPGDYSFGNNQQCTQVIKNPQDVFSCVLFRSRYSQQLSLINLNELDQIVSIYVGKDFTPSLFAQAEAETFAQYLGNKPTQQKHMSLGEIPRYCLDAVIAIEDPNFLEHQGISLRGLMRAAVANLRNARWSQGGSTITQQLVKNYFLTPEKTIKRKLAEIVISLIFEFRVSKDDILETYLNIIYLGQSGVYEVRGYGAASNYYFNKPIGELDLSECSLLAAVVNNPGRFDPVRHPERAQKRRTRVLNKMMEQNLISQEELELASRQPLPKSHKKSLSASAPYYVDAVNKKLKEFGIKDRSGLKVYTALDPQAQEFAEQSVVNGIKYFETNHPVVKKIKQDKKLNLQAALLASNPLTGEVVAIVGGRNFTTSPYNRAIESQRQVGSVFKPLVYLTALQNRNLEGQSYNPLTPLNNSPFKYEYDRQVWEPNNYDKTFSAPVPLFYALKESMNVPTARLGIDVGLGNIIQTARDLGAQSSLKEYPSISLGAFELNPMEVLKIYNGISQLGTKHELLIVKSVENQRDDTLYSHKEETQQVGNIENFAVLVGMMKETLISGTGRASRRIGFDYFAAGKTGTTSDTKDAWFAGFTPFHTAVVWVGYDENISHSLTGASGALPIWTQYMKKATQSYANRDFDFPATVEKKLIEKEELIEAGVPKEKAKDTELVFKHE